MMDLWNGSLSAGAPISCANALVLMRRALAMLDEAACPPDIGAHLDLAAARLDEWLLSGGAEPMPRGRPVPETGTYS